MVVCRMDGGCGKVRKIWKNGGDGCGNEGGLISGVNSECGGV